jgi:hypothetical protein
VLKEQLMIQRRGSSPDSKMEEKYWKLDSKFLHIFSKQTFEEKARKILIYSKRFKVQFSENRVERERNKIKWKSNCRFNSIRCIYIHDCYKTW